jgi:hypothetical protein
MAGYHKSEIPKGFIGEASKITEEYLEFIDANSTNNPVMELVELSDLCGSIDLYVKSHYNLTIEDLLVMTKLTQEVFKNGYRK